MTFTPEALDLGEIFLARLPHVWATKKFDEIRLRVKPDKPTGFMNHAYARRKRAGFTRRNTKYLIELG